MASELRAGQRRQGQRGGEPLPERWQRLVSDGEVGSSAARPVRQGQVEVRDQQDPGQLGQRGQMIAQPLGGVLHAAAEEAWAGPVPRQVSEGAVPSSMGTQLVEGAVLGPAAAGGRAHFSRLHRVVTWAREVNVLLLAKKGRFLSLAKQGRLELDARLGRRRRRCRGQERGSRGRAPDLAGVAGPGRGANRGRQELRRRRSVHQQVAMCVKLSKVVWPCVKCVKLRKAA